MKRALLFAGLFCVLFVAAASAADTSFAGTWSLDKSKSEGLQGPAANINLTWTVTQDEKTLTVESKAAREGQPDRVQKVTFNLDGTETTADVTSGRRTGKNTTTAKWADDKKSLTATVVFKGKIGDNDVTSTTTDKLSLADDGKTLSVARTAERQNGKQESKLVFEKK